MQNQEAKSTKTVGRHNIETREIKQMVRKYQKFQKISQKQKPTRLTRSQPQTITIAIAMNCSRRLVQEKFQTNMHRLTTRAHMTISVKQQEQKTQ